MDRIGIARNLRRDDTRAEKHLWAILRNGQLGGYKFRRQVPIDVYFADFACMDARLIVELDGVTHVGREGYDAERTAVLQRLGWRLIRFDNHKLLEWDSVAQTILAELELGGE